MIMTTDNDNDNDTDHDILCQGCQVPGGYERSPGAGNEEGGLGEGIWGTRGQKAGQSDHFEQVT